MGSGGGDDGGVFQRLGIPPFNSAFSTIPSFSVFILGRACCCCFHENRVFRGFYGLGCLID